MRTTAEAPGPRGLLPALFLTLLLGLGGCATTVPECNCAPPVADCFDENCSARMGICNLVPAGASHACVIIDAQPTSAAIYIDGDYVGTTPLQYSMWFESNTRYIRVLAQPIHANQAPQERLLQVPPVPRRLQFFMNNPNRTSYGTTAPAQAEAPAEPRLLPGETVTGNAGQ